MRRLSLSLLAAGCLAGAAPGVAVAASCDIRGQERTFGPTYVTSLSVTKTGCATGKKVVRAFHRCRKASGGVRGRCTRKVLRFSCKENRGAQIQTQFSAKVTCTRGARRVVHTYTQFT